MGLFSSISNFLSGGNEKRAKMESARSADVISNVQLPNVEDMKLQLDNLVQQGVITPEQAQAALVEASAFEGISTDPSLMEAQLSALTGLKDIYSEGGLTAIDRAKLNEIKNEELATERGQREAILQNAKERGIFGSGLELASQLANQQSSATRANQRGTDVAALAQQRALDALLQSGQLAGNIQNTQFNQQAQVAAARDALAKFNAQNQQQVNLQNVAAKNAAQEANLKEQQRIADTNVDIGNKQQQYNKELLQKQFENDLTKNKALSGALSGYSKTLSGQGESTSNLAGNLIGAATSFFSDEDLKEEVEDFDPSKVLDELTAHLFKYKKGTGLPQDKRAGVMAQEVEKTPEGKSMVVNTNKGKMIDGEKAQSFTLAALADLHKRLKDIEGK